MASLLASSASVGAQVTTNAPDSLMIDLGYGIKQKLSTLSAAVSVITAEDLKASGAVSLSDALYGRLLGLTALKTGGFQADDNFGANFNVRGLGTFSENGLLIIVDGFRRPIDRLTVDEVESVAVLKDAAAVALLGYEGINGALFVTTKNGKKGGPNIDVTYRHQFLFDPKVPDFTNAFDYASALNEARLNDGLSRAYSDLEMELFKYGTDPYLYPNVNWKDQVLKNNANEDEVNIAVHGGSNTLRYYTFLDYTDARGALKGTNQHDYNSQLRYSKANIRANLDITVTPSTEMKVNMLASFIETAYPGSGSANAVMGRIFSTPSNAFPVMTRDGVWGGNSTFGDANPVAQIQSTGREKTHARALYANAMLIQHLNFITRGLSFSLQVGYDNLSQINERHGKSFQYGYDSYTGDIGDPSSIVSTIYGDKINNLEFSKWLGNQWRTSNFAVSVNYDRTFGSDHNVSAAFIYNTQSSVSMGRYNTFARANLIGYANYTWKNRFNATMVLAGNGSNRSYPHKWSFSPNFSAAYMFVDNKDSKGLNFGKIRASFGIQHSDYVPVAGLWLESYDGGHGNIVFRPNYDGNFWGSYLTHYPLSSFPLETAYKYNLGIDLRLFGGLNFTADGYYYRRSNIMMSANDLNSWVVGRPDSYAAEGKVDSYGIEVGLNYYKQITRDFLVNAGVMFTWGSNRIKNYIELPPEEYQSHVGQRVGQAYGLEAIGFFKDEADIANSPTQTFSNVKPGDVKYKDQNNDGIINEHDAVYFGYSTNIPETNYAFNLGAEFKGFGFSLIFQGATGQTAWLGTTGVYNTNMGSGNLSQHYYDNVWKADGSNADSALYPRLTTQDNPNNNQASSIWYRDIDWLKLRSAEIYYRLPASALRALRMQDVKIYVQGRNLFTASNVKEIDPEVMGTQYPVFKGINLGLILNF